MKQTLKELLEEIREFHCILFIHEGRVFSIYEDDERHCIEDYKLNSLVKHWKVTDDEPLQTMIIDIYI